MKILALLCILSVDIAVTAASTYCVTIPIYLQTHCNGLELKPDQPLNISDSNGTSYFNFIKVNGSISSKTLSTLSSALVLAIEDSKLSRIEDGALCSIPYLREIRLRNSLSPPILTEGQLRNCNKLTRLSAPGIKIELSALPQLTQLYEIDLTRQNVTQFTADYLAPLQKLQKLTISNSEIKQIEPGAICVPPNLRILILKDNKHLPTLTKSMFENCQSVKELKLRSNENLAVDENAFSGFSNVYSAVLDGLNIKHLKRDYLNGLSKVGSLEITNSDISGISSDTFADFTNLNYLSLRGNKIREFNSHILRFMPKLKKLDMSRNYLSGIENFKDPSLEELLMSLNNITNIDSEVVKLNLPKLRYLEIGDYQTTVEYNRRFK